MLDAQSTDRREVHYLHELGAGHAACIIVQIQDEQKQELGEDRPTTRVVDSTVYHLPYQLAFISLSLESSGTT